MDNSYSVNNEADLNARDYLRFAIGNDSFGLKIDCIRELIKSSEITHMTKIPIVHKSIMGVINLRGEIIPMVDLSMRLHEKKINTDQKTYGIIVQLFDKENHEEKMTMGAMVESLTGIVKLNEKEIFSSPGFASSIRSDFVTGHAKFKDELTVILNLEKLIDADELSAVNNSDSRNILSLGSILNDEQFKGNASDEKARIQKAENISNYIEISIAEESYGIEISKIREVIEIAKLTAIPNTKPFMKGVINLRDEIIPVLDMRERCGLEPKEYNKKTLILIINYRNIQIGLIVDSVNSVVKLEKNKFQFPPHYNALVEKDFISGMCQIDDDIIVLLDIDRILSPEEHNYIEKNNFSNNN